MNLPPRPDPGSHSNQAADSTQAARSANARVQTTTVVRGNRYIAMATQLPFVIFGGYGLGYALDHYFGTTWLRVACLFAAIIGGLAQFLWQILRDQSKPSE